MLCKFRTVSVQSCLCHQSLSARFFRMAAGTRCFAQMAQVLLLKTGHQQVLFLQVTVQRVGLTLTMLKADQLGCILLKKIIQNYLMLL